MINSKIMESLGKFRGMMKYHAYTEINSFMWDSDVIIMVGTARHRNTQIDVMFKLNLSKSINDPEVVDDLTYYPFHFHFMGSQVHPSYC